MIRFDGAERVGLPVGEPHLAAVAEGLAQAAQMLEIRGGRELRDADVVGDLLAGQAGDGLLQPRHRAGDRPVLLRRALAAEHREPQLEREQLAPGETHRPEEVVGDDGDLVGLEEDLQSLDEPAGHLEPLRDREQVLQDHVAVRPDHAGERAHRMRLAVGEERDQVEDAAELVRGGGHWR